MNLARLTRLSMKLETKSLIALQSDVYVTTHP
jgi:hypothetical protein